MSRNISSMFEPDLLPGKFDRTFKAIIGAGWAQESSGNVEAPTGYFALIPISKMDVDFHTQGNLWDAVLEDPDLSPVDDRLAVPEPGWYVTTENNSGLIWVFRFSTESAAIRQFAKLEAEYYAWDAGNEEDEG